MTKEHYKVFIIDMCGKYNLRAGQLTFTDVDNGDKVINLYETFLKEVKELVEVYRLENDK